MASGRSRDGILELVRKKLREDPARWYCDDRPNCCAKSRVELFAAAILEGDHIEKLREIRTIRREKPYFNESHNGETPRGSSNREEERTALNMYGKVYPEIGRVVDYQLPLKNSRADRGVGKIDLLSYRESDNALLILELKRRDTKETLLRAVLEIFTYSRQVCSEKLISEFNAKFVADRDPEIKPAVLLFEGSYPYEEYISDKSPNTIELMNRLGVYIYVISREGEYDVFKPARK